MKQIDIAMLCLFSLIHADLLIDDHTDGTNQNELEYYWYYYDDNYGVGANDRPQSDSISRPSVIDVSYTDGPRHFKGYPSFIPDMQDKYTVKTYQFTLGEENDNKYATMPFTFGSSWNTEKGIAQPYVGCNAMLNRLGSSINLKMITGFRFKIRSHKDNLRVCFKVKTKDIDEYSIIKNPPDDAFGYWNDTFTVTNEWNEVTVSMNDLTQPDWAKSFKPMDIEHATNIAWEICREFNPAVESDTLDIDDIYMIAEDIPQIIYPVSEQVEQPFNLVWKSVVAISMYQIEIYNKYDLSIPVIDFLVLDTTIEITSLPDSNNYIWRVRGVNEYWNAKFSDYAEFFTVPTSVASNNQRLLNTEYNCAYQNEKLQYSLPFQSHVKMTLHDLRGSRVKTVVNQIQKAGTHSVVLKGLARGTYLLEFQVNENKYREQITIR